MARESTIGLDLRLISRTVSAGVWGLAALLAWSGWWLGASWLYPFAAAAALLGVYDLRLRFRQDDHTILCNFGIFGAMRYMMESIGPELRQYWIANDIEERPFSRRQRAEVYRYAKNETVQSSAFGTLEDIQGGMIRHSMFPVSAYELEPYKLTFGEERGCPNPCEMTHPYMISAMSFGALGENAVRALARGAKAAGILMNTGEGGFPKYPLEEGANVIFQLGTAKFGARNDDATLNEDALKRIAAMDQVKMIEIKLSQGAKPGKGGLLPAAKVSREIAELRGVPPGRDVYSPPRHVECDTPENTVGLIRQVQRVSELPVGIKLCVGSELELRQLLRAMKSEGSFPDYISVDGAEGGTGAAPQPFMDHVGTPLSYGLKALCDIADEEGVRGRFKIVAAGKLLNPGAQLRAMAMGAQAIYIARGFMFAVGCIQALQCNKGTCPVGVATHDPGLQRGLDIDAKAERVFNYVKNMESVLYEVLAATGRRSFLDLDRSVLYEGPDDGIIQLDTTRF